jgi:hypothetical protein
MAIGTALAVWACKGNEEPSTPSNPSMEMDASMPSEMGMPDGGAQEMMDAAMMTMDAMH